MALSEQEEFEMLSLERERALSTKPDTGSNFLRQAGLAARSAGPIATGAALGGAMGAPIGGVGAVPGAVAGATSAAILQLVDQLGGTNYIEQAMDKLGLPKPETGSERVFSDVVGTTTAAGGIAKGAQTLAKTARPIVKDILESLGQRQGLQVGSAASGAAAGGMAREEGAGPLGQAGATLAGAAGAPAIGKAVIGPTARYLGNVVGDVGATVGAGFGNQRAINRISRDAATRVPGEALEETHLALRNRGTEFVPGAKPTVAETLAEQSLGKDRIIGGAVARLQKDLTGAKGIEDILPSVARKQGVAIEAFEKDLNLTTAPMRKQALDLANSPIFPGRPGGVPTDNVLIAIDRMAAKPGTRASDVVQKSLSEVKDKIRALTNEDGMMNAEDLYTIRKEIGNTIGKFSKETANWDKKLTSGIERSVQGHIDSAIEGAGGSGWKAYLSRYASGMKNIEAHEDRLKEAKRIVAMVKGGSGGVMSGEVPKIPTLLSRPMMLINYGLKMVAMDAETPIARKLAQDMQDPKKFADLMKLPDVNPMSKVAEQILIKATMSTILRFPKFFEKQP